MEFDPFAIFGGSLERISLSSDPLLLAAPPGTKEGASADNSLSFDFGCDVVEAVGAVAVEAVSGRGLCVEVGTAVTKVLL